MHLNVDYIWYRKSTAFSTWIEFGMIKRKQSAQHTCFGTYSLTCIQLFRYFYSRCIFTIVPNTMLSQMDDLVTCPYQIATTAISYGWVTKSSVWNNMMLKKSMGGRSTPPYNVVQAMTTRRNYALHPCQLPGYPNQCSFPAGCIMKNK